MLATASYLEKVLLRWVLDLGSQPCSHCVLLLAFRSKHYPHQGEQAV
jgi:hypothetical protein